MKKHTRQIQVRYPSEYNANGALYSSYSYNFKNEGSKEAALKYAEADKKKLAVSLRKNNQTSVSSKIEILDI